MKNLRKIQKEENCGFKPVKPKLSDLELVSLNIAAKQKGIDSEYQLFREIKGTCLFEQIERSVYNKRKRKLAMWMEGVRLKMVKKLIEFEDYFTVDSMPLEICKNARAKRSKICREEHYSSPNMGYCASQNTYYYGYKLHTACSLAGIIQSYDLTPASVHDIKYLQDIKQQLPDCVLLGGKGYLSSEVQVDLLTSANIKLKTPMRKNQKNYKKRPYVFRKHRKRIETIFSQLCDQFMIRRNYAKMFSGFKVRIISKIMAFTTVQYLNKFVFNRKLNNIKVNLI